MSYLSDVRKELKNVKWLTTKQVSLFTVWTVIISLIVAYYLGLFDLIFAQGLKVIVG